MVSLLAGQKIMQDALSDHMVPNRKPIPLKQRAFVLLPFIVLALVVSTHPALVSAEPSRHFQKLEGSAIYRLYCASCHGVGGKGDGPVAPTLKVPPPDLTTITLRAGGKFPSARVARIITYGENISAHGSQAMPLWGAMFTTVGGSGRRGALYSRRAVIQLKRYLESIQQR
jgi:mono/diheme cytochrome c family protein